MKPARLVAAITLTVMAGLSLAEPAWAGDAGRYADRQHWPTWAVQYWLNDPDKYPTPVDGELVDAIRFELIRGYPVTAQDYMKYEDREFRPNSPMTRAEFAAVLSRSQSVHTEDGVGADWFLPYVEALRAKEIIPADASEKWSDPISRREAAQWMGRAANVFEADDQEAPAFTDVTDPLIERALRAGIVKGTGGGRFEPDRALLRVEAAVMLVRLARARNSQNNAENQQLQEEWLALLKEADRQHTERMKKWVYQGYLDEEIDTGGLITQEMADWILFLNRDAMEVRPNVTPSWSVRLADRYTMKGLEVHDTVAVLQISGWSQFYRKTDPEDKPYYERPFYERQFLVLRDGAWVLAAYDDPVWE